MQAFVSLTRGVCVCVCLCARAGGVHEEELPPDQEGGAHGAHQGEPRQGRPHQVPGGGPQVLHQGGALHRGGREGTVRGAGRTGPHYTLFSFSLLSFIFVCVGLRNFYFTDFFFLF